MSSMGTGGRPCWNNSNISASDPACPRRHQVSIFYFVTTVVGMIVLALFTLLFLFCLFLKRRRIQLRLNPRARRNELRAYETTVTFYPATDAAGTTLPARPTALPGTSEPKADNAVAASPFTCVIMAGESQPTFIAHPIPSSAAAPPIKSDDGKQQSSSESSTIDVKS